MIMTCHDADMKREGREEGIKKIAYNLKIEGVPIDTIIKITGLSKNEIENL